VELVHLDTEIHLGDIRLIKSCFYFSCSKFKKNNKLNKFTNDIFNKIKIKIISIANVFKT